jgi:hypothetical protein
MVEAFLQASSCLEHTKNAWLTLKKAVQELSTTKTTSAISAQDKILRQLSAIVLKLSAPATALPRSMSYTDQARLAPPQNVHEKLVPSRGLKEMTVKVIDDPRHNQTRKGLVEAINAAHSSKAGKVLAAWKLKSRDIAIVADTHMTRKLMEEKKGWTKVFVGKTKMKGGHFTVTAHSVRTNRIEVANQEKSLAELQAQNPLLKGRVKFLRVAWQKRTLKGGKLAGPLLMNVRTLEEANTLVTEGLVHNHDLKNCELFHYECQMTLYFKCQGYGHIAATCRKEQTCGVCAQHHPMAACPTSNAICTYFCCNCKGKHRT